MRKKNILRANKKYYGNLGVNNITDNTNVYGSVRFQFSKNVKNAKQYCAS